MRGPWQQQRGRPSNPPEGGELALAHDHPSLREQQGGALWCCAPGHPPSGSSSGGGAAGAEAATTACEESARDGRWTASRVATDGVQRGRRRWREVRRRELRTEPKAQVKLEDETANELGMLVTAGTRTGGAYNVGPRSVTIRFIDSLVTKLVTKLVMCGCIRQGPVIR